MKKLSFFVVAAFLAVSVGFVSCTKDEDILAPTITFDNVTGGTVTLEKGVSSYTVNATIVSIENLKTVKIYKKVGSVSTQIGQTVTSFDNKKLYNLKQVVDNITEDITIIVRADNGSENESELKIKYTQGDIVTGGEVETSKAKILGAQSNSSVGSSYGVATKQVYLVGEAATASASVDFIYFFSPDASIAAEIFSPNSSKAQSLNGYKDLATKNDTKFKLTDVSAATFDAFVDDATIVAAATDVNAQYVEQLTVGKVVAFKLSNGKLGLFKVSALDATASGSITIDVKVQK
ncbi:hypothetical protein FACS189464_3710 [Bacteroidia bacterium]|nr:hypothetical protein FACS189430_06440 [Bacteroidia bacterium]GHT79146.1 hypothetical protein FACS189464_3710 [Bacteroidia bacterium]